MGFMWFVPAIVSLWFLFFVIFIFLILFSIVIDLVGVLGVWYPCSLVFSLLVWFVYMLIFHDGVVKFLDIWVQKVLPSGALRLRISTFLLFSSLIRPNSISRESFIGIFSWRLIILNVSIGNRTEFTSINLKYLILIQTLTIKILTVLPILIHVLELRREDNIIILGVDLSVGIVVISMIMGMIRFDVFGRSVLFFEVVVIFHWEVLFAGVGMLGVSSPTCY